jgi:hypothetical protein
LVGHRNHLTVAWPLQVYGFRLLVPVATSFIGLVSVTRFS